MRTRLDAFSAKRLATDQQPAKNVLKATDLTRKKITVTHAKFRIALAVRKEQISVLLAPVATCSTARTRTVSIAASTSIIAKSARGMTITNRSVLSAIPTSHDPKRTRRAWKDAQNAGQT